MLVVFPVPGGPCSVEGSCDLQMGGAVIPATHSNDDVRDVPFSREHLTYNNETYKSS